MKPCPSCGYGNPDEGRKCGICARDITSVPVKTGASQRKESKLMLATGLLLLACGAVYFVSTSLARKPVPASAGTAFSDEAAFSYDGALYALDRLGNLRFLPSADRKGVLPLLSCPDDRVACAAAKLAGAWASSSEDPAERKIMFEALLRAASAGGRIARRSAAAQAALAAAGGFPVSPYLEDIRKVTAALVASSDAELMSAGYLLASTSGLEDFSGEMLNTLRYDPSSEARLYAACGLARLGSAEGGSHLVKLASGGDPELRSGAFSCLAYSFAPDTGPFLAAAARARDPDQAGRAKMALMLRKQLAIIKK